MLVPSFDSSVLEFRRLLPLLESRRRTWAIDLVGWGFTDVSFGVDGDAPLGPTQKREHLFAFWKEHVRSREHTWRARAKRSSRQDIRHCR